MFKTILVPTDGSSLSDKAIAVAVAFAKQGNARLIGLSIAEPGYGPQLAEGSTVFDADAYARKMHEIARMHVDKVAEAASIAEVPCETLVCTSANPYEEIIRTAKQHECDAIFMASHGRKGLSALFIGSETHKVLAHSSVPVLVIR